jgi:hypothetical protein
MKENIPVANVREKVAINVDCCVLIDARACDPRMFGQLDLADQTNDPEQSLK